tara:strand:+ start:7339 stop:8277 length:939 start_codon:yes stop_codon:yes gene_type:complete
MRDELQTFVGGLDDAIEQYGGARADWLDLSTRTNPVPYPAPAFPADVWTARPDHAAFARLTGFARSFWNVPDGAAIVPAAGTSAIIAALPHLREKGDIALPGSLSDDYAAAFLAAGWRLSDRRDNALVAAHPNSPNGHAWTADQLDAPFVIIDESYCDVAPDASLIHLAARANTIIIKSFSNFWGLAGVRLGFAIGDPALLAGLSAMLGSYNVSGPALAIGTEALADPAWADDTRARLAVDALRLDAIMDAQGAPVIGGTSLFRLYEVADAAAAQLHFAQHKIWCRTYAQNDNWLRLGLPAPDRWGQIEAAF